MPSLDALPFLQAGENRRNLHHLRYTAAADPVRWTVLHRLGSCQACVCELQEHISIPANLLSYHLKVLRDAGLVTTSRRGRWIDYALADDAAAQLQAALPVPLGDKVVWT